MVVGYVYVRKIIIFLTWITKYVNAVIVIQSLDDSLFIYIWFIIKWCSFLKGRGCSFGMFSVTVVFPMTMIWGSFSFSATKDHSSKKYWQSTVGHSLYPISRLESVLGLSYPYIFLEEKLLSCRPGMSHLIIHILF